MPGASRRGWVAKGMGAGHFAKLQIHGDVKDVERLKKLFDLFAEVLDELCRMGSATEEAPGVAL